jgi:hypothetical protein
LSGPFEICPTPLIVMTPFLNMPRRLSCVLLAIGLLAPVASWAQNPAPNPAPLSKVRITTSLGDIEAELYADKAPPAAIKKLLKLHKTESIHVPPIHAGESRGRA